MDVDDDVDVAYINRALEKVVQAEATIAIAMHDTMSRKANNGERIDQVEEPSGFEHLRTNAADLHDSFACSKTRATDFSSQVHELDVQRHNIDCAIKRILVNKAIDGCNERIMAALKTTKYKAVASFVQALVHLDMSLAKSIPNKRVSSVLVQATAAVVRAIRYEHDRARRSKITSEVIRFGTLFPKLKLDTEGIEAINVYLGEEIYNLGLSAHHEGRTSSLLSNLFCHTATCFDEHCENILDAFGPKSRINAFSLMIKACDQRTACLLREFVRLNFEAVDIHEGQNESCQQQRFLSEQLDEICEIYRLQAEYELLIHDIFGETINQILHTMGNCGSLASNELCRLDTFYSNLLKRQLDEISESMNLPSTKSVAASGNEADEFFFVLKTCINRCLMSGFPRIVKSTFKTFVPIINAKVEHIYSLSNEVSCFSTLNGITIFYSRLKSMLNYAKGRMEQGSILDETLLKDEMQLLEDVAENMWRKIDERIVSLIAHNLQNFDISLTAFRNTSYQVAAEPEHTLSSWIGQLVHVFEQEVSIARNGLDDSLFGTFTNQLLISIVKAIEEIILDGMRFTQHGCLNLEQDIRVLVSKLSDLFPDVPVRNIFSRVHQIFYVLNVESLQDAALLQAGITISTLHLLTDSDISNVLRLRVDFDFH
jgi:hypothetical protein